MIQAIFLGLNLLSLILDILNLKIMINVVLLLCSFAATNWFHFAVVLHICFIHLEIDEFQLIQMGQKPEVEIANPTLKSIICDYLQKCE